MILFMLTSGTIFFNICFILYLYINWKVYFEKYRVDRRNSLWKPPFYDTKPQFIVGNEWGRTRLKFDHVYVSFNDFLRTSYLILPNTFCLGIFGTIKILVRGLIIQYLGMLKPKSTYRHTKVVYNLMMESVSNLGNFSHLEGDVAVFKFENFSWISNTGTYFKSKLFQVKINLNLQTMEKAEVDGKGLTVEETMILAWWHTITCGHEKIHAVANWGIDVNSSIPLVKHNSIATVIYNYMGFNGFLFVLKLYYWTKCLSADNSKAFQSCTLNNLKNGIQDHRQLVLLKSHSNIAKFVLDFSEEFKKIFLKNKQDFPGMDWHSLFTGTVLHSIDHTMAEKNLPDPFLLRQSHSTFGNIARIGQFVRMAFVTDLPMVLFTRKAKDVKSGFYCDIYTAAKRINPTFADMIDICIIK